MRRILDILLAYALVGALVVVAVKLAGEREPAAESVGRPYVIDGDTLVLNGECLRLLGIDAPELAQSCDVAGQEFACGRQARESLRRLAAGEITCRGERHDQYRRRLVTCRTSEGDVGERLVAAGEAVSEGCCAIREAEARAAKRGIWASRFERPADWRRMNRGHE